MALETRKLCSNALISHAHSHQMSRVSSYRCDYNYWYDKSFLLLLLLLSEQTTLCIFLIYFYNPNKK